MRTSLCLAAIAVLAWSNPAAAQTRSPNHPLAPDQAARLERAEQHFRLPYLLRDSLVTPHWIDGDRIIYWDEIGPFAGTFVELDARTGERGAVIAPDVLRKELERLVGSPVSALSQLQFTPAPDGEGILFQWQDRNIRLGVRTGGLTLASEEDQLAVRGARFAPVGGRAVISDAGGFQVIAPSGVVVERSGEPDNGWTVPSDAWSPDGNRLVLARSDRRALHRIPIIDYDGGLELVTMTPYPKTGTPLPIETFHVVDARSGEITTVPSGGEGYEWFVGWRADSREAFLMHLSRDGKRLELAKVDQRGERRLVLVEERPETNVGDLDFIAADWATQFTALADGGFLWLSERDGWRHVYRYDREGRLLNRLTTGDYPVRRVEHVRADGTVLLSAALDPDEPYDQQLYRTTLDGGALQPVSTAPGVHRISVSPSGRYVLDSWAASDRPRVRDVVDVDGGRRHTLTASDDSAARALGKAPPERVSVLAADGETPLHGAVFKPADFDPARHYPVVAYIYGGPFSTVLSGGYLSSMSLRANSLAQAGFIVIAIDVRGSSGRSKAFQDATYGRVGQTEIPDYVTGLGQIATTRPWMDMDRVGIVSHSWGGYYALRGMLTAPDTFHAGYAGAPGALEEDASVNEPNMGLLEQNPAGYAQASNAALAKNLVGHLRIMHGTSDTSATLSTTLRMAEALVDADKQFELLLIPGMEHNSDDHDGAYYHRDVVLYFLRTLGAPL